MKTALCISNFLRTWKDNFPSLKDNFLDIYNPDIFIHTWNSIDSNRISPFLDNINSYFSPKKILIESPISFSISERMKNRNNKRNINSVLSMFYSIQQSNHLKTMYENMNGFKYDCVIRFRTDIKLFDQIYFDKSDLNKITIPKYGNYDGINDQFAWSSSENMDKYCSTFSNIKDLLNIEGYKKEINLNPEELLYNNLIIYNIQLFRPEIKYVLCKTNGEIIDNKKSEELWTKLKQ